MAYRGLLRYQIQDPTLEYNLGNAEFRLGHLGAAILHYERARRLEPTDPDIRANLEYAQSFRFDRVETPEQAAVVRWLHAGQDHLGPDRQAWFVVFCVWLVAALLAWCSARPQGWKVAHGWTLTGLALLLVLAVGSWYATMHRLGGQRSAVILDQVVEVLAGPGHSNPALFTVHEGLTVRIRAEREEWLQVSLPNGLNGWVSKSSADEV